MGVRWRGRKRDRKRKNGERESRQRETGKDKAYLLKPEDHGTMFITVTSYWRQRTFGQIAYHLNYTDLPSRVYGVVNISCPF